MFRFFPLLLVFVAILGCTPAAPPAQTPVETQSQEAAPPAPAPAKPEEGTPTAEATAPADPAAMRIVSIDGSTTETLYALGAGDLIVARDSGSTYPESAVALPDIGNGHQISIESVLEYKPTIVIGRDRAMSGPALTSLESVKLNVLRLPEEAGVEPARARIRTLGNLVGKKDKADELVAAMDAKLDELNKQIAAASDKPKPRVLVVYLRPGVTLLMGDDSNAMEMVRLVGAENATPGFTGYKDLNAEAVIAAAPEIVLCYKDGLESVGGEEKLWQSPGLKETPAGRNKRLVVMDDLLLAGFGPRTGDAALELFSRLHENAVPATEEQAGAV